MASVSRMNRKVIDLKLECLEEQRDLVLKSFGDYVNKVVAKGRAWADGTSQNQSTFSQVSQMIDFTADFLDVKFSEIKDVSDRMLLLELSVLQEAPQDSTNSSHLSSVTSTTPSPLARCHSADGPLLQPVLTRCDQMEDSVGTLHTDTVKLKDVQDDLIKQLENISKKQFHLDQILSDVVSKQTVFENSQFSEDQTEIKKLTDEQTRIVKQQELKIDNLETQLEVLSSEMKELKEFNKSRTGVNDDIKSSIDMINVHLELMKNQTDPLSSALDDTSLTVWNLSNKTEAVEELTQDLSKKVSSNKQAIQQISTSQEQLSQTVKKLEDLSREAVSRRDLEVVEKQVKEAIDNYKMLCVMLSKRLQPLEQLRNCLNKKVQEREDHDRKLFNATTDLEALTAQVGRQYVSEEGDDITFLFPYPILTKKPIG